MVVRKAGTPISAKKKGVEEMKKLNEKKQMMMKEESEEEEDTSEEEEDSGSDNDGSILESGEGSEDDEDDDDDDDDDDGDDDGDDDDDESEEESANISPKKLSKEQIQTPTKSTKTPNKTPDKQSLLASSQKNEAQSSKKTSNKKKNMVQNDSSLITSPKKIGRTEDDSAKTPSPSKQQKDVSPVKGIAEKRRREDGDEEGAMKRSRIDAPVNSSMYSEEKRQRDRRCLFVKLFPKGTTEDEIKALSKDILSARIPGKRNKCFAFIEFACEEKAEENFPILEKSKIKGQKLYVDYVGEKSQKFQPPTPQQLKPENKKRLFLSGLPSATTMEDIGKHFPHAVGFFMRSSGNNRFAHLDFDTEAAGEEALKQNCSLKIKGHPVTVMYANKSKRKPSKGRLSKQGQQKAKARNQRVEKKKKEEEEEEDEDDDDDEEELEEEESDESDEE